MGGPLLTFVIFHGICCLNELAKMLENPFGHDAEDISVDDFHGRFLQMMEGTDAALPFLHEGSSSPKQTVHEHSVATTETAIDKVIASAQGAPGGSSVTGVWCELPQQSLQQAEEREPGSVLQNTRSNGVLQHPRSIGVSADQHSILPMSGNSGLFSSCWGLLCPDPEAGQSKELPFKNVVECSSKPTCATGLSLKEELRDLAEPSDSGAGLNVGITAQDSRGMAPGNDVIPRRPPTQESWVGL